MAAVTVGGTAARAGAQAPDSDPATAIIANFFMNPSHNKDVS